jgi:hypothetical protein
MYYCTTPNTWTQQSGGGGGSGSLFTTHGQGWFAPAGFPTASNTSVNSVAGQMRVFQISLPAMTVGRIAWNIATAQPSSNMGVAIYNASCTSLLASSTAGTSTASIGAKFVALSSPYIVTAGAYIVAFSFDTANVVWYQTGGLAAAMLAESGLERYNTASNTVTWSGGNPTFPVTCGTLTSIPAGLDYPPTPVFMP